MTRGKIRILVADDEPNIVTLLRLNLEQDEYDLVEAFDGEEALRKVREDRPDLILLDVMMPKKDGHDVCREIKGDPETAGIRVILITAKGEADRQRGMECGADLFLTKPFSPMRLLDEIRRLVSGSVR